MDPRAEKNPGLHLPEPSFGRAESLPGQYEEMETRQNTAAAPELPPVAPPPVSAGIMPPVAQTLPPQDNAQPVALPTDDAVGDDLDKEWVNKAKMIVEKTKGDPYLQSHEMGQAKADFLRIRFNKHIKVAQDKAL